MTQTQTQTQSPLDAKGETLADELKRLVGEYQDDDAGDATKAEAWNMIADFAVENAPTIVSALSAIASQEDAAPSEEPVACKRCQGNGEVVTDWDRHLSPHAGDKGDETVAECTDCGGTGITYQTERPCACQPATDVFASPAVAPVAVSDNLLVAFLGQKPRPGIDDLYFQSGIRASEISKRLARVVPATKPAVGVVEALKAAEEELRRLRCIFLPEYEGKIGEPDASVLAKISAALSAGTATPKPEVEK